MDYKNLASRAFSYAVDFVGDAMSNPNKPMQASVGVLAWGGLAVKSILEGAPGSAYADMCGAAICATNLVRHFQGATEPLQLTNQQSRNLGGLGAATSAPIGVWAFASGDDAGGLACVALSIIGGVIYKFSDEKLGSDGKDFMSQSSRGSRHDGEMLDQFAEGLARREALTRLAGTLDAVRQQKAQHDPSPKV